MVLCEQRIQATQRETVLPPQAHVGRPVTSPLSPAGKEVPTGTPGSLSQPTSVVTVGPGFTRKAFTVGILCLWGRMGSDGFGLKIITI